MDLTLLSLSIKVFEFSLSLSLSLYVFKQLEMIAGTLKIQLLIMYAPIISRGGGLTAKYPVTLSVRRAKHHTPQVVIVP